MLNTSKLFQIKTTYINYYFLKPFIKMLFNTWRYLREKKCPKYLIHVKINIFFKINIMSLNETH